MIRFAENLNKMIEAGLGGAMEAPSTEVAVGHCIHHLESSGAVASFETNIVAPIRSLRVDMQPIQAGSGDPSPDNIRPITGRDSVTVTRTGKNLWNDADFALAKFSLVTDPESSIYGYYYGIARSLGYSASSPFSKDNGGFIRKTPIGGTVTVSLDVAAVGSRGYIRFYYEDGTDSGTNHNIDQGSVGHFSCRSNPAKSVSSVNFVTIGGGTSKIGIKNLQIERSDTETTYEPYDGQTVTVQLGQTVYGGTVDVTTGTMTVTSALKHLSDLSWAANASANTFNGTGFTERATRIDGSSDTGCYCDTYTWYTSGTVTGYDYGIALANTNSSSLNSRTMIYVKDTRYSTVNEFTASFATHDPVVVCPLAEPITIQLIPAQLSTLKGQNNVWSDTGDVTLEYPYYEETEGY